MCAYPVQAMATCASRLASPRLWPRAQALSQRKCYRVKPKYYKDVAQRYAEFRREVSERRKEFRGEWFEREQAAQSELRIKAVEEARRREMEEVRALEEAKKELERMAREREMVQAEAEKQIQLKRERGEHARLQAEEKAGIIHAQKVLQVEKAMENAITLDNLEAKIQEALENEVLDDFILSPTNGEKITKIFRSM